MILALERLRQWVRSSGPAGCHEGKQEDRQEGEGESPASVTANSEGAAFSTSRVKKVIFSYSITEFSFYPGSLK